MHDEIPASPSPAETLRLAAEYARSFRSQPWGHVHMAVADWLDSEADRSERITFASTYPYWIPQGNHSALTVARAYLGESA